LYGAYADVAFFDKLLLGKALGLPQFQDFFPSSGCFMVLVNVVSPAMLDRLPDAAKKSLCRLPVIYLSFEMAV
jgi:hypothetical protein